MSLVSFKSFVASVALAVSTAVTFAAAPAFAENQSPTFATGVVKYNEGTGIGDSFRRNTDNALGSYLKGFGGDENSDDTDKENFFMGIGSNKNENFLSLGMDGEAIFEFGTRFTPEITIWETTWGDKGRNQGSYDERVEVFVGNELGENAEWISLGVIQNIANGAYNSVDGATITGEELGISEQLFRYVRLVDMSNKQADGFDVNAIAVSGRRMSLAQAATVPEPASILGLLTIGVTSVGSLGKRKKNQ